MSSLESAFQSPFGIPWRRHVAILAFVAIAFVDPGEARSERSSSWDELSVTARLDVDGRLHVRERQAMVLTGAWSGGERVLPIRRGEELDVGGVFRGMVRDTGAMLDAMSYPR